MSPECRNKCDYEAEGCDWEYIGCVDWETLFDAGRRVADERHAKWLERRKASLEFRHRGLERLRSCGAAASTYLNRHGAARVPMFTGPDPESAEFSCWAWPIRWDLFVSADGEWLISDSAVPGLVSHDSDPDPADDERRRALKPLVDLYGECEEYRFGTQPASFTLFESAVDARRYVTDSGAREEELVLAADGVAGDIFHLVRVLQSDEDPEIEMVDFFAAVAEGVGGLASRAARAQHRGAEPVR